MAQAVRPRCDTCHATKTADDVLDCGAGQAATAHWAEFKTQEVTASLLTCANFSLHSRKDPQVHFSFPYLQTHSMEMEMEQTLSRNNWKPIPIFPSIVDLIGSLARFGRFPQYDK